MNFSQKIKDLTNLINHNLNIYLEKGYPEVIYEAMSYSVNSGGKRFRPILSALTYEAITGNFDDIIEFACALEFIHTYSLIHDDLPSMDDDDYRRGNLTCHKVFGEAIAILAGDALLNLAFEVMINKLKKDFDYKYLEAMELISKSSGVKGMIGGQAKDILSENKKISKDELIFIHQNKTAKLIQSSIMTGAIIAGLNKNIILELEEISYLIGIAFQIQDDILDVTSDMEVIGKPTFSDDKNNKSTYVTLFGIDKSKEDYLNYSNQALIRLEKLGFKDKFIYQYIKSSIQRQK